MGPAASSVLTFSTNAAREVAAAAGARFGGSFYVDSLSETDGPAASLLELQRHNVDLIGKGLLEVQR